MNVETITSRQNPLMTHLRKLAFSRSYRKKSGEYLCDGTKLLDEALKWGAPVQTAVFSDGVEKLEGQRYLVLDGVQDPGNVGTILRTADAFECDGVFLVNACADLFNPKTARATMGAIFRREAYSVTPEELFALLSKSGVPLYGTALREDTVPLSDANLSKAAVAIGSEGRGLSQQMLDECAKTLKIPMSPRCESLNAAIAATVVLWEMYR